LKQFTPSSSFFRELRSLVSNGLPQFPLPSSGSSPKRPETLTTLFSGELWPQGRTQKTSVEEKRAVLRSHSSSPFLEASQIIRGAQIATGFQCQIHQALEGKLVGHLGWAPKTKSIGLGSSGILLRCFFFWMNETLYKAQTQQYNLSSKHWNQQLQRDISPKQTNPTYPCWTDWNSKKKHRNTQNNQRQEQPQLGTTNQSKQHNPTANWKLQTKAIKPGSEFGDSRDEQDQFYPLSVSQIV